MASSDKGVDTSKPSNVFLAGLVGPQKWLGTKKEYVTYAFTKDGLPWAQTYEWTAGEKTAFKKALATFSAVADIDFKEVGSGDSPNLQWRLVDKAKSSFPDALGYHQFPNGEYDAGDGYFVRDAHKNWLGQLSPGGYAFVTIIHELGHGLGLEHPHDGRGKFPGVRKDGDLGTNALNQGIFTMMSYNDLGGSVGATQWAPSTEKNYGFEATPMAFDIAALQLMYGANKTHADGNDTYALQAKNTGWSCIWDTGGRDAITFSGKADATIDLRAATLDKADPFAGGRLSHVDGVFGGFTIAKGVAIENAEGGAGNDTINGNEAGNRLEGNGGADAINGYGGDDRLLPGTGEGTVRGGAGEDWIDFSDLSVAVKLTLEGNDAAAITGSGIGGNVAEVENIDGSSVGDTFVGDKLENKIDGNGGGDDISGGGGFDTIDGGAGNDGISGGEGHDRLDGGADADTLSYKDLKEAIAVTLDGDTWIYTRLRAGNQAEDLIRNFENVIGTDKDDAITGDGGSNVFEGGEGADTLDGRGGKDALRGGLGLDTALYHDKTAAIAVTLDASGDGKVLVGGVEEDTLKSVENVEGGSRGDSFTGGNAHNEFKGLGGNDTFFASLGVDRLDGGADTDKVDFDGFNDVLTISLAGEGFAKVGATLVATLVSIEDVQGSRRNDVITGSDAANTIRGGFGDDTIKGAGGQDTLDGQTGVNTLDLSDKTRSVSLQLNRSTDALVVVDLAKEDTVRNFQNVVGGSGNDFLYGDGDVNKLMGGAGDDVLRGGTGLDTLDGQDGSDTADFSLETGAVVLTLAAGVQSTAKVGGIVADFLHSIENVVGGTAGDTLTGDANANRFDGRGGADDMFGMGGDDVFIASAGFDRFDGGEGFDTVDYSAAAGPIQVALAAGNTFVTLKAYSAATKTFVAEDNLKRIEKVIGSIANDEITGSGADEVLQGWFGADTLRGGAGSDTLKGGAGVDHLDGGSKTYQGYLDYFYANEHDAADFSDKTASVEVTLLFDTAARAPLLSTAKVGGVAEDTLVNIDDLIGGSAGDKFTGNAAANRLYGGGGVDTLKGMGGSDVIQGGDGVDILDGGANTYFDYNGSLSPNSYDTADFSDRAAGLVLTLSFDKAAMKSVVSYAYVGGVRDDSVVNFEGVTGTKFNDTISGDAVANRLSGGDGADTLNGAMSDDELDGGLGKDTLIGGLGKDWALYADRTDEVRITLSGGKATAFVDNLAEDTLDGIENLHGGDANDKLGGDAADNYLQGSYGNDTLFASAGKDSLNGGADYDLADYSAFKSALTVSLQYAPASYGSLYGYVLEPQNGTAQKDYLIDIEKVKTGSGGDKLFGSEAENRLDAGAGADELNGREGDDKLAGGAQSDTFFFGGVSGKGGTMTLEAIGTDTIEDWNAGDKIKLFADTFAPGPNPAPAITADTFGSGKGLAAKQADDVIFYDTSQGWLWFDRDAGGAGAATHFATLATKPALTAGEFAWA